MFICKNYVPVIKWKGAEKEALKELTDEIKNKITPLIQLVMPSMKNKWREEKLDYEEVYRKLIEKFIENKEKIPQDILNNWGEETFFLDFTLLYQEIRNVYLLDILEELQKHIIKFIPVFHLSDRKDFIEKIVNYEKNNKSGFCLKLTCGDFNEQEGINGLNKKISEFFSEYDLKEEDVDLIIDIQEKTVIEEECDKYYLLTNQIDNLKKFRSYIFSGGSFPSDLSDYSVEDSPHYIERKEWKKWKEYNDKKLKRVPIFSDYTVQHPIYEEKIQFYQSSASMKYTLKDYWIILRGQKGKYEQYLANAELLSENKDFFGENYSYGDKYINEQGKYYSVYLKKQKDGLKLDGTGNALKWIKAFINHHITLTTNQIATYIYKK